jgi:hypothetical protein
MANSNQNQRYDPLKFCTCLDNKAKWWWSVSLLLKALAFVIGSIIVLAKSKWVPAPFVVAALGLLSELAIYRSDWIKGLAQGLRRKLDQFDSFGWAIARNEYSDLLVRSPKSVKTAACQAGGDEPYFASKQLTGPHRAVENLQESSWWSKHLTEQMGHLCAVVLVVSALFAIGTLIVALHTSGSADTTDVISRVVTSLITLVLSLGTVRLMLGYYAFGRKAGRVEDSAERLLGTANIEQIDAVKLMSEYHVARATAPVIPTWIWKAKREELNRLWNELRLRQKSGGSG